MYSFSLIASVWPLTTLAMAAQEKKAMTELLSKDTYAGRVGAFEGANYQAKGYYRPAEDCIMFSRDDVPFCGVCQAAIRRAMELYLPARASGR